MLPWLGVRVEVDRTQLPGARKHGTEHNLPADREKWKADGIVPYIWKMIVVERSFRGSSAYGKIGRAGPGIEGRWINLTVPRLG